MCHPRKLETVASLRSTYVVGMGVVRVVSFCAAKFVRGVSCDVCVVIPFKYFILGTSLHASE